MFADTDTEFVAVGKSSFHVGFWHVYDAELSSETGAFEWDERFALELTYARSISEQRLVNSTLSEMSRHTQKDESAFEGLRAPLSECFANVSKGDQFLAERVGADEVRFSLNHEETCRLESPGISRLFFGIWLSDNTRSNKQSRQLRGLGKQR